MMVIGLLGGIASGKSTVSQVFATRGAFVFNADQVVHQLLQEEPVLQKIKERFGNSILNEKGQIQKNKLAALVFKEKARLDELNQILHPLVFEKLQLFLQEHQKDPQAILLLDIPLLMEKGLHHFCNTLVFIDTPLALRQKNASQRGWSSEELQLREQQQLPLLTKKEASPLILSNVHTLDQLQEETNQLWDKLISSRSHS